MADHINNKVVQKIIFIISLVLVIIGGITILTIGFADLFKFETPFIQPLTTKGQPYIIILIAAFVTLILCARNLRRIKNQDRGDK